MRLFVEQTFVLALRSRQLAVSLFLAAALMFCAWLASQMSARQPATVCLDVGFSFIRIVLPMLGLLLVQNFLAKDLERKNIFYMLSYPASRSAYLLGRYVGILLVLLLVLLALGVSLAWVAQQAAGNYQQSTPINTGGLYLLTLAAIFMDVVVVVTFSVLITTLTNSANLVFLASLGFMVCARSIGAVLRILDTDKAFVTGGAGIQTALNYARYFIPDLGMLDIRAVALYNTLGVINYPLIPLFLMPFLYCSTLMGLAAWLFSRRKLL